VLFELSDLTINELARHTSVERSALSRVLDQLAAEGLIERRQKSVDKRALSLRITGAGRAAFRTMRPVRNAILRRATDGIPPEDIEQMLSVVRRMLCNLEGDDAAPREPSPPPSSRRKPLAGT
jgi:DNA-binding MarR family transcriptional regulator